MSKIKTLKIISGELWTPSQGWRILLWFLSIPGYLQPCHQIQADKLCTQSFLPSSNGSLNQINIPPKFTPGTAKIRTCPCLMLHSWSLLPMWGGSATPMQWHLRLLQSASVRGVPPTLLTHQFVILPTRNMLFWSIFLLQLFYNQHHALNR